MASSGNFAIMNNTIQLGGSDDDRSSGYTENGNLKVNVIKQKSGPCSSIGIRTSGKYYFEVYVNSFFGGTNVALVNESWNIDAQPGWQTPSQNTSDYDLVGYYFGNGKLNNAQSAGDGNNFTSYGSALTGGSVLGVAVDVDNGKVWFHKDGTYPNSGNPATGANPARGSGGTITTAMDFTTKTWFVTAGGWGQTTGIITYNFGQDSTFGGEISAGGNQDSNSHGDFKYSVPSGFTCLSSNNVPISDDIDPAQTDDDFPSKQFNAVLYTGNGSSNAISGLGFKPDLVWGKSRSASQSHRLYDSSRGGSSMLFSDTNAAAQTGSVFMTSFDSDGFTYSSSGSNANDNTVTYVAWCWRANGGTTATNSEGNHDCTLQANAKAGFSIMTLGNYTSASGVTIGHGLDKAPFFYIHKPLNSNNWHVYHSGIGATKALLLNTTAAQATAIGYWANTEPTADVLSLGNTFAGTSDGVVYAWAEVEGYSKFGTYVGNGNADGPFIYTGFRPRLVVQKRVDGTGSWRVWDSARHTFNPNDAIVRWEDSGAEDTANASVSFLSNGFKIRITYTEVNADGGDYVYMCWGDVPFKYNNTF